MRIIIFVCRMMEVIGIVAGVIGIVGVIKAWQRENKKVDVTSCILLCGFVLTYLFHSIAQYMK